MELFNMFELSFLILFYIVFIGRSIMLRLAGINPFVIGKGKMGLKALIEILLIPGLLFWSWEVFRQSKRIDSSLLPEIIYGKFHLPVFMGFLGIVLTGAGFVLFIMALVAFGDSWRVGVDKQKPGELVTSGVFKFSRNPIFLFMDLYFIGTFLVYPSAFFGIFFLLVAVLIHYQIIQEERHLQNIYGQKYISYLEKTPRYFGLKS